MTLYVAFVKPIIIENSCLIGHVLQNFLQVPSLRSERKFSVKEANASNDLLTAIEEGNTDDVRRVVSKLPEGITSALNTPSLLAKHKLRTPLMAAAAKGNFAEFTAILNAFDRQYDNKVSD